MLIRVSRYTTLVKRRVASKSTPQKCLTFTRWPTILTGIINTVTNVNHELHNDSSSAATEKLSEGKGVIAKLSALKHDMGRNGQLV